MQVSIVDRAVPVGVVKPEFLWDFHPQGDYHQQYLAKNPDGYCGIGGCGVPFKVAELQVGEKA